MKRMDYVYEQTDRRDKSTMRYCLHIYKYARMLENESMTEPIFAQEGV